MSILDDIREILLPGDISTTTVSDLPVDISPRYVIEQDIIPFRSVRKPELTPIRDVEPVLRSPIKAIAPVRGRARNIPELPGQAGTRLWPLGADPDMKATGFSGLVPTMNRSFGAVGLGEEPPGPLPPTEPVGSRVQNCVAGSFSLQGCGECCDDSFQKRPFKRRRCKKKCESKFAPTPTTSSLSLSGRLGYNPNYADDDPAAYVPAYTNPLTGRKNYSPTFGHYNRGRKSFRGMGWSPGAFVQSGGMIVSGPSSDTLPSGLSYEAGATGECTTGIQGFLYKINKDTGNCELDLLKIGLIGIAAFLVIK